MVANNNRSKVYPSATSINPASVATTKTASVAPSKASSIAPSASVSNVGKAEKAELSLTKSGVHNPNPLQHGAVGTGERAFSAASTFISGIMAISASQFIGAPLKLVDPKFYDAYMAWTKESFAVLMTTITQWWSPTIVRVGGDASMKGQLYQMEDGTLKCNFPHRLVLMANHQLYTDWLYLWWIAYTNKMHGRIYIILKESLKQLPIFGWGAQFYNFIFLSRKWDTDQYRFRSALNHLKNPEDPMWLMIFPEGTNLSAITREKSAAWAKKSGVPDMKHGLLPRSTGLQFCLKELKKTTNWLYDCTIAYEGVPEGLYGQDVFTLKSSFFEGRPPKSVNMFWRRFKISEIPLDNEEAFGRWLINRWREKDYILEYFYKFNEFPAEEPTTALLAVGGKRLAKHSKTIDTEVKAGGWDEFLSIFGPITSAAGTLSSIDMTNPVNLDELLGHVAKSQPLDMLSLGKDPLAAVSQQLNYLNLGKDSLAAVSQQAVRNALMAAQRSQAIPPAVLNYLIKEPPKTQQQMQQALVKSAKKSGNTAMAQQAQQALAANKALSKETENEALKAAKQNKHAISQTPRSRPATAQSLQKTMPMANQEALVTRPLTTIAVQKATASAGNVAGRLMRGNVGANPKVTDQQAAPGQNSSPVKGSKPSSATAAQRPPLTANNLKRQKIQASSAAAKRTARPVTVAGA